MHYKGIGLTLISAFASGSLANPSTSPSSPQLPQGFPLLNPAGTGSANINLILGGGILPTLTIAGGLAGASTQIVVGASQTLGIGGNPLPTGLIGGGVGLAINPFDVLAQLSATASEGGWLNGLVPTMQAGVIGNGDLVYQSSSGMNLGGNLGGGASVINEYGGIIFPSSSFVASVGGNFGFNIQNGAVPTTSSTTSSSTT